LRTHPIVGVCGPPKTAGGVGASPARYDRPCEVGGDIVRLVRFARTGLVGLVTLAVVGCGSSSSTPSTRAANTATTPAPSANVNSCSAVTQADAANALGQAVTPGVLGRATVEGGLACVFFGPAAPTPHNPNVAQADSVRVVVVIGVHARKWYEDYKSKVSARPVPGYGDQAYFDGFASLSILKGDRYARIAVVPAGGGPSLSAEEKLAAAILPRL
jgi:hypothetical protein